MDNMNLVAQYRESKFNYAYDSQKVFRCLMESFTFPGKIVRMPRIALTPPQPELIYVMEVLLTLLDIEVSFNVCGCESEKVEGVRQYIHINTGSSHVGFEEANYVLYLNAYSQGKINQVRQGSLETPHHSATLFYSVRNLSEDISSKGNGKVNLSLRGPGIKDKKHITFEGIKPLEVDDWIENRRDYPLGADIYLISNDGCLCGLPRSVKIFKEGGK